MLDFIIVRTNHCFFVKSLASRFLQKHYPQVFALLITASASNRFQFLGSTRSNVGAHQGFHIVNEQLHSMQFLVKRQQPLTRYSIASLLQAWVTQYTCEWWPIIYYYWLLQIEFLLITLHRLVRILRMLDSYLKINKNISSKMSSFYVNIQKSKYQVWRQP